MSGSWALRKYWAMPWQRRLRRPRAGGCLSLCGICQILVPGRFTSSGVFYKRASRPERSAGTAPGFIGALTTAIPPSLRHNLAQITSTLSICNTRRVRRRSGFVEGGFSAK